MRFNSILRSIPLFNRFFRAAPYVYVALGDSTVEGVGASDKTKTYPYLVTMGIKQKYRNVVFHNLGVAGSKTDDLLASHLEKAISLQPDLVTISIGANDIFKRVKGTTFEANLSEIIMQLKNQTSASIVINTIPDFSAVTSMPAVFKAYCQLQAKRFNKIIYSLAEREKIILVDFYLQTKIMGKRYPELISSDGLHPSDFGYAIWAQSILVHVLGNITFDKEKTTLTEL
jgi:lysophospholipase L1-like esterase